MSEHDVIRRTEMLDARIQLGGKTIELAPYAATGLMGLTVAPRGQGKTNAGLVVAEQLSQLGWLSVLVDPEGELGGLYGNVMPDPETLRGHLERRDLPVVVVQARDAGEFLSYGHVIFEAADACRKPLFVMIDEGQLFSSARRGKGELGAASALLNEFAGRGRKRALDLFVTALSYSNSLSRSLFGNANLTLLGAQHDAAAWGAVAPLCSPAGLRFGDLNALQSGEFYCFSKGGTDRVRLPLAAALRGAALKAPAARPSLPRNYGEWDRAVSTMPDDRLLALTPEVIGLLSAVAGLSADQVAAGTDAQQGELEGRTS